jgi:hypothetical protein
MLRGAVDARGKPGWVIMDLKVDDWESYHRQIIRAFGRVKVCSGTLAFH